MSEGREREKWQHTSQLLSMQANTWGGQTNPSDYDPFAKAKTKPLDRQQARDLLSQLIRQSEEKAKAKHERNRP